jgi:hypothetical protein
MVVKTVSEHDSTMILVLNTALEMMVVVARDLSEGLMPHSRGL